MSDNRTHRESERWPTTARSARSRRSGTRVPRRARRPALRGADGRGGLLLRLLAALPPRRPVGDRRQPGLGAARPDPHAQPPAQAAAPEAARAVRRRRAGSTRSTGAAAGARQRRRPDLLRRRRRGRRRYYRNAVGDECVYVEQGSGTVETVFGVLPYRAGDYVVVPRATTHRWVPAEAEPALRDRGQQPRRAAEALPVALRPAARARAVLRARPARPRRAAPRRTGDRRRGAREAPHHGRGRRRHPDDLRDAPVRRGRLGRLPLPATRSTSRTSCRSPARCTSRRRCTRSSRATTSWSATSCRARSTTTRCRSRCPTTTRTSTPTR